MCKEVVSDAYAKDIGIEQLAAGASSYNLLLGLT
jgi:hypothetical protein